MNVTLKPETDHEAQIFIMAWVWSALTAEENGWITREQRKILEEHAHRLIAELQQAVGDG